MTEPYVKSTTQTMRFQARKIYKGAGSDTDGTSYYPLTYTSDLNGVKLASWKKRIRSGVGATTYMVAHERSILKHVPGYLYREHKKRLTNGQVWLERHWVYPTVNPYPSSELQFPTNAQNLSEVFANNMALTKFIKNAREAQSSFSGGVFLGELRETLRAIRNPADSLRRGLHDYLDTVKKRSRERRYIKRRQLDKKTRESLLNRMISGTWLEYSFGWAPLMRDVRSGAEALARRNLKLEKSTKVVRGSGKSISESVSWNPSAGYGGSGANDHTRSRRVDAAVVQVFYTGAVRIRLQGEGQSFDMENFGMMPKDFLPTVWELVPWSFLVDYFTNVGDIISAYSFGSSNFVWKQKTVRRSIERTVDTFYYPDASWLATFIQPEYLNTFKYVFTPDSYTFRHKHVIRDVHTGSLVPTLEFSVPGFGRKWGNITALGLAHKRTIRALR